MTIAGIINKLKVRIR